MTRGSRCGPRLQRLEAPGRKRWQPASGQLEACTARLGCQANRPVQSPTVCRGDGRPGLRCPKVEKIAATFEPFAFSFLFEMTAIVAFGFGFSHCRQPRPALAEVPGEPTPAPHGPRCGRKSRRGATKKDAEVVKFVEQFRARHGRDPSIPEVQAAFPGMPTSTAQRYRKGDTSNVIRLRVA